MSLQQTEAECAANAVAPRVSLKDIEAAIATRYDTTGDALAIGARNISGHIGTEFSRQLQILSVCLLVMRNGFTIIGKSAPASPENFNSELGRKLAYEDAIRQLWPLMGFALRNKLAGFA
jgi:hypothetical protein